MDSIKKSKVIELHEKNNTAFKSQYLTFYSNLLFEMFTRWMSNTNI